MYARASVENPFGDERTMK